MRYIVIGLGNYGSIVAQELTMLGHEVIGVDQLESRVDHIKESITTSFVLDATDEQALSILPLRAVDVVIVAIGEDFGSSVKVVALLKKNKVNHIYARAVDAVHKTVLEAFNLDRVLLPEQTAARSLVQLLDLNVNVESFQIDRDHYVVKFDVPNSFVGFSIEGTSLQTEFDLKVIALLKGEKVTNSIGISILDKSVNHQFDPNYKLTADDQLVCYGKYKDFLSFWRTIS